MECVFLDFRQGSWGLKNKNGAYLTFESAQTCQRWRDTQDSWMWSQRPHLICQAVHWLGRPGLSPSRSGCTETQFPLGLMVFPQQEGLTVTSNKHPRYPGAVSLAFSSCLFSAWFHITYNSEKMLSLHCIIERLSSKGTGSGGFRLMRNSVWDKNRMEDCVSFLMTLCIYGSPVKGFLKPHHKCGIHLLSPHHVRGTSKKKAVEALMEVCTE